MCYRGGFDRRFFLGRQNTLTILDKRFHLLARKNYPSEIAGITVIDSHALVILKSGVAYYLDKSAPSTCSIDDEICKVFGRGDGIFAVGEKGLYEFSLSKGFEKIINMDSKVYFTGVCKTRLGTILVTESSIHLLRDNKLESVFRTFATTGNAIEFADIIDDRLILGQANCKFFECDQDSLWGHLYTHESMSRSKTIEDFPEVFRKVFFLKEYSTEPIYTTSKILNSAKIAR